MSNNLRIEKTILEQIIDRMIGKLKDDKNFTDSILEELKEIDLSSMKDVKQIISKEE